MTSAASTLTFLGAAGTVTGSKFLVDADDRRLLVDCGLFQGEREWRRRNWQPPALDPASLDGVVVTHAHLDHCGYLPVLVAHGFRGPVVCSEATARLMAIVLRDAAHLQEEEARWSRQTGLSRHAEPRPLFDTEDAERALALLRPVAADDPVATFGSLRVELRRSGHILGSRFAVLHLEGSRVVFSGDLGRPDHPLLRPPEEIGEADYVVVESTYGDRRHEPHASRKLAEVLTRTIGRGGTALLPAFAVDRTPMLLHEIRGLVDEGLVPDVPVYVDSPMALAALDVYRTELEGPDHEYRPELTLAAKPFDPGRLQLVESPQESTRLNDPAHPCIVISASGMAEGGRVLHHLEHQLPRRRNTVILTGYQVAGTRGRALADGAPQIKIHGRYVPVRAEVVNVQGFSAHADGEQLVSWLSGAGEPRAVFVVHGEPESAEALARQVRDRCSWTAVVARHGEKVRVD